MNKFKSVKVTHNILQRIDFFYLTEFLRFMGIFVCEEILTDPEGERTAAENRTVYSAQVYVGKREVQEEEAGQLNISTEEYKNKVGKLPPKTVMLCDCLPAGVDVISDLLQDGATLQIQKNILNDFLNLLLGAVFEPGDATGFGAAQLTELINVYVDHKIWLHSLNMQYYGSKPSAVIVEAEECFLAAHEALKESLVRRGNTDANEQYLYEYALLWCQVKANSACACNKEILYFSIEKLPERCRTLYEKYPGFTNALILQGLSYEPSPSCANEAVAVFMEALDEIGSECFASAVYYWIGKRYEGFRDKRAEANRNYEMAYQHKVKFRNIFKLAIAARDEGDAESALEQFDKISSKLALKRKLALIDPLELEYLYKAYFHQMFICYKQSDYVRAIEYGIQCKDVWEKEIDESRYFDTLYGAGEASAYKELLKERLVVSKVYRILMESYVKVFNKEQAEIYREKIREAALRIQGIC